MEIMDILGPIIAYAISLIICFLIYIIGVVIYNAGLDATKNHKIFHVIAFLVVSAINFFLSIIVGFIVNIMISMTLYLLTFGSFKEPLYESINITTIIFMILVWSSRSEKTNQSELTQHVQEEPKQEESQHWCKHFNQSGCKIQFVNDPCPNWCINSPESEENALSYTHG